jgi:hypothetical protein
MTAEIINLRQARKRKQRGEREAKAQENRTRFGRSKEQVSLEEAKRRLETKKLDGRRIDPPAAGEE